MPGKKHSTLKWLLFCVVFMGSCAATLGPLEERIFKVKVGPGVPDDFPFLALTRDEKSLTYHPRVVFGGELASFTAQNHDFTFLVPEREEARLLEELRNATDPRSERKPFSASFEVRRLSADRQSLRLEYDLYDDLVNVGWYEATAKSVAPKYQKRHGDIGLLLVPAFLLNALAWGVGFAVYFVLRRLLRKAHTPKTVAL